MSRTRKTARRPNPSAKPTPEDLLDRVRHTPWMAKQIVEDQVVGIYSAGTSIGEIAEKVQNGVWKMGPGDYIEAIRDTLDGIEEDAILLLWTIEQTRRVIRTLRGPKPKRKPGKRPRGSK